MGNTAIDFLYKVRGVFSPNGLQKVFCSFHPSDIEQMERITGDILSQFHCAVYYHTDSLQKEDIDLEDYELKLREMKLFVVIVTSNYLMNSSLSKNWEYGFALKHNIPIIPIMAESGLEEFFSIEMNRIGDGYGDIQLLKLQVTDKTEISYQQKLLRDFGAVLLNDEEIERVKKAFSGQIFLSYRKKDRRYANELMRAIHNIPSLQNVSIWYDEFISSGERWNDQIVTALKNSDLFLLMATPSIMEPDNYVIKEEYPAARAQNKKIISVRKTGKRSDVLNLEELEHVFPGLKILIDGDNTKELERALHELADNGESSPEKNYLIGLAFFNGIEVEQNHEKAVSLIMASAQKGLPDAVNKLAEMYWLGDGVAVNYENSILWQKKLVTIYEAQFADIENIDQISNYIMALEHLTSCLYELSAFRDSLSYGRRFLSLMERIAPISSELYNYHIQAYDLCGKNCLRLGLYDDAVAYAGKYCSLSEKRYQSKSTITNFHHLAVAYERMGDVYYFIGDLEKTAVWYSQAWEINLQIDKKLQSADSACTLSASCLRFGDIYMRNGMYEKAEQYYLQGVNLRKKILDAEPSDSNLKTYGEAVLALGSSSLLKGNIQQAEELFSEAKEIMCKFSEEQGTIESWYSYSVVLNRCGKICEIKGEFSHAMEYYSESLEHRGKILSRIRTAETVYEYALTLFFRAGVSLHLYDNKSRKKDYEEIIRILLPVLSKDGKGDWHQIFAESAFAYFEMDTFTGKRYLQYAIDAWRWLADKQPKNKEFRRQYELCQKIYQRCYPESI